MKLSDIILSEEETISNEDAIKDWIVYNLSNKKTASYTNKFRKAIDSVTSWQDKLQAAKETLDNFGYSQFNSDFNRHHIRPDGIVDVDNSANFTYTVSTPSDGKPWIPPPFKYGIIDGGTFSCFKLDLGGKIPMWLPESVNILTFNQCGAISLHNIHKILKNVRQIHFASTEVTDSILGLCQLKYLEQVTWWGERTQQNIVFNAAISHIKNHDVFGCQDALKTVGKEEYAQL